MNPRRALLLCLCLVLPLAAAVETANQVERGVRFEYRIVNRADRPQDITIRLALPQSNERQEVLEVIPEPGYASLGPDSFGNRVATYVERDVQPGEMRLRGWLARVRTAAAVWQPLAEPARLSDSERRLYTRDRSNYQITSPVILALRDRLIKPGMDDEAKARAIFAYLTAHVAYYRDDKWDTAPDVLQKGQGSCSEYNFAFIALLRACAIPARYSGGPIINPDNRSHYDPRLHEDAVFHRWTEVFLPRWGWLPVDASRGSTALHRFDNVLNLWGRLPAGSLQTYRGDGGEDEPLGWDYLAASRPQLADSLRDAPVAYWIESDGREWRPMLERIAATVESGVTAPQLASLLADTTSRELFFFLGRQLERLDRPMLVDELLRAGHPGALYVAAASDQRQLPLPAARRYRQLADVRLGNEIARVLGADGRDWPLFEYWWRKARAEIAWSADQGRFVLTNPDVNIY